MTNAVTRVIKKAVAILLITGLLAAAFWIGVSTLYPYKYMEFIVEYAEKYDLPPSLVCAVIHTESRFRTDAVSPKNAAGLMQLTQATADWGAKSIGLADYSYDNIMEPRINIELGCWYLRTLMRQFGQDTDVALAAYNAGSGNVEQWLLDKSLSSDGKRLENIPFGETRRYVERVNAAIPIYRLMLRYLGGINE